MIVLFLRGTMQHWVVGILPLRNTVAHEGCGLDSSNNEMAGRKLIGEKWLEPLLMFRVDSKGNVVVSDTQKHFFCAARSPPANPQTSRQPSIDPKSKNYY